MAKLRRERLEREAHERKRAEVAACDRAAADGIGTDLREGPRGTIQARLRRPDVWIQLRLCPSAWWADAQG